MDVNELIEQTKKRKSWQVTRLCVCHWICLNDRGHYSDMLTRARLYLYRIGIIPLDTVAETKLRDNKKGRFSVQVVMTSTSVVCHCLSYLGTHCLNRPSMLVYMH
jgi:hypothetical protein